MHLWTTEFTLFSERLTTMNKKLTQQENLVCCTEDAVRNLGQKN